MEFEADQGLPDEIILEIFKRTEPKTATRCPWLPKPDCCSSLNIPDGSAVPCLLPIEFGRHGWWTIIGSQYGNVCIRYSLEGFTPAIKTWNPLLDRSRDIEDPARNLYRQAMSGYAFGYTVGTYKYFIVHVSKRHIKDRFVHCNVFSSTEDKWKHGYMEDGGLRNLSSNSVFHEGKAFWINWIGRFFTIASDMAVFDVERFEIHKIKITRSQNQHFQNLAVTEDKLLLLGYELTNYGVVNLIYRVDITKMKITPWKRVVDNRQRGIPCNPIQGSINEMLIIYEKIIGAKNPKDQSITEIEVWKLNLCTQNHARIYRSWWFDDMSFADAALVSQGLLIP
ncbi:hypothetical protein PIB30_049122 [Stylosanthes scabra]|uniref:F-box associated domain-containing protein n=1 Tax=Stylosanthes scabra TaxID=79078 RepID=A0ABU6VF98_9FABA|nr:hypothetical protein [Stylosanthes scabra]